MLLFALGSLQISEGSFYNSLKFLVKKKMLMECLIWTHVIFFLD